jgi:hypothetical protein
MRKLAKLLGVLVLAAIIGVIAILWPKIDNMGSEYGTASAIRDIEDYLRTHKGKWPSSPADLGYPAKQGRNAPVIDYSLDSRGILANPELLDRAVMPKAGRFYTYPHHRENLARLLEVLRETNAGTR